MATIDFDVFIQGKIVDLVVLNEGLVENTNWYKWFNDEELMQFMQQHYFPNTKTMQLEFFKKEINNSLYKLQLGIVHKKDKILIGVISLNNIDYINKKCEISGFIGERRYQKLNPFMEANKLIIRHAFENLNMNRIYGGTAIKAVLSMYCRILGFKQEGVKKEEMYKNGKYVDTYMIGLLRKEYNEQFE